ncbi:MAG: hypothetical protein Q7U38_08720 [Methylobacter sp.]|nr:hypothetical protein [Methylobacter sp.]MDP2100148.1 hypothetical protein [Methylobacter sp.]MDP2427336.1 hypothetical protein [Methylobacter sp.]MDP3054200.1 hypothetical protein [Methylobacter sp.]MDP3361610.1 hypothetical protein [Methylobacter sp.]
MLEAPKIIGQICAIETIAEGNGIRELHQLKQRYGQGNWRKKKGVAAVEGFNGEVAMAEIHWYEAHGIGKVKLKIKRWL